MVERVGDVEALYERVMNDALAYIAALEEAGHALYGSYGAQVSVRSYMSQDPLIAWNETRARKPLSLIVAASNEDAPARAPVVERPDLLVHLEGLRAIGRRRWLRREWLRSKRGGYAAPKGRIEDMKPPPSGPGTGAGSTDGPGQVGERHSSDLYEAANEAWAYLASEFKGDSAEFGEEERHRVTMKLGIALHKHESTDDSSDDSASQRTGADRDGDSAQPGSPSLAAESYDDVERDVVRVAGYDGIEAGPVCGCAPVSWNQYNRVVQCHRCGRTVESAPSAGNTAPDEYIRQLYGLLDDAAMLLRHADEAWGWTGDLHDRLVAWRGRYGEVTAVVPSQGVTE